MLKVELNTLRVLMVDDNAQMRRILRTLLHGLGIRDVVEAEDGASGIEAFQTYSPDLVITDWIMPMLDGREFTRMLRDVKTSPNPYVPIIALTGHADKRTVIEARDAGVTEFMCKPISAKGLYDRVLNVIVSPRPFVRTKRYFGPDRRRFQAPNFAGEDRRTQSAAIEQPAQWAVS